MKTTINKLFALLVMAVFILSIVPFTLAEIDSADVSVQEENESSEVEDSEMEETSDSGDDGDDSNDETDDDKAEEIKKIKSAVINQLREKRQNVKEDLKEKRKLTKEQVKAKPLPGQKIKELNQRIKDAREKYQALKDKREEAIENFKEHKKEFDQVRRKAKECVNGENEECAKVKKNLKKGVRQHLIKTSDVIAKSLEKTINRVESAVVLSAEEKEQLLAELEADKAELAELQEKVAALAEEASAEELKEAIKDLKKKWQELKKVQQKAIAYLISSKTENVVEKVSTNFPEKMQAKIDRLAEAGVDVSELEEILEKYNGQVETLKQSHEEAKEKLVSGDLTGYKEAQRQVKENLQETKVTLREFMKKFAQLKQGTALENVAEEQGNEETEETETVEAEPETTE